jgi:hypothetical protein
MDPYGFQQAEDVFFNNVEPLVQDIVDDPDTLPYEILLQCKRDLPGMLNGNVPAVQSLLKLISMTNTTTFTDVLGRLFLLRIPSAMLYPDSIAPWLLNATTTYHLWLAPAGEEDIDPDMLMAANKLYPFIPPNVPIQQVINLTQTLVNQINTIAENANIALNNIYSAGGFGGLLNQKALIRVTRLQFNILTGYNWDPFFTKVNPMANDFVLFAPDYFANVSKVLNMYFSKPDTILGIRALLATKFYMAFRNAVPDPADSPNITQSCYQNSYSILYDNLFADYTAKFLNITTHTQVYTMLRNIITQFETNLELLPWLDDYTKNNARLKASLFSINIGGPTDDPLPTVPIGEDFWDSYVTLTGAVVMDSVSRVSQSIDRNNEPWDRDIFFASPINAFYDPFENGIFIETPIIANSFFITDAPLFHKYAGIGVVTGHEMTHGFDNQGRYFDWYGDYYNWWSNSSATQFEQIKQCIIQYYSNARYHTEYNDGKPIDGDLTQGENIADFGGVKFSYRAWQQAILNGDETYTEADIQAVFGMPSTKLFFLAYAQLWCQLPPTEFYPDVHSTSPMRVLGPLANSADFQKAWQCPVGSLFHPPQLCTIW